MSVIIREEKENALELVTPKRLVVDQSDRAEGLIVIETITPSIVPHAFISVNTFYVIAP